jgi:F-type H+-transporting ATPase subunit delta
MHGASADSLAALTQALDSVVDDSSGRVDPNRIAEDLFGVSHVLRREPSLRRTATDLSLDPQAKSGLVRQLFGGQLDPASLDLVADAAGRRWAGTRDLADALEQLAVIAVVEGAERTGGADTLEDELFAFGRLVEENPDLRDALSDPARSVDDKRSLVRSLLEGKAEPAAIRLAEQSVTGTHRTVPVALEEYQKVAAEQRHRLVAVVEVARELPDGDLERLRTILARQYGRPVHVNVLVNPEVVGGVRVEIGDDVIDGTVANRLDEARRRLAG